MNLLRCLPNIRVADRNYLHTVITVDNTQVMGKVLDVFKQKTGNTFSVYRRPKSLVKEVSIITITRTNRCPLITHLKKQ